MDTFKFFLNISRPRFWLYLAGTYLVGFTFGTLNTTQSLTPLHALNFFYFLLPANLFLYGINDFFDTDTDRFNQKKVGKENVLKKNEIENLKLGIIISFAFFFIVFFLNKTLIDRILLVLFLTLSFIYSSPPLRLKSRPILDFSSNILYAIPGFIGFSNASGGHLPPIATFIAAYLWTSGMHLFSAIPDIKADKKAQIKTSAVFFGFSPSLILVTTFWGLFCLLVWANQLFFPYSFLLIIYPLIPLYLLLKRRIKLNRIYWFFPYLNVIIGFCAFLLQSIKQL